MRYLVFILLLFISACAIQKPLQEDEGGDFTVLAPPTNKMIVVEQGRSNLRDIGEVLDSNDVVTNSDTLTTIATKSDVSATVQTISTPNDSLEISLGNTIKRDVVFLDSVQQVTGSYALNTILELRSNGAKYKIEASEPPTYASDGVVVIDLGSNYAVLQADNGQYEANWIGAIDDNTTDNATVFANFYNFDSNGVVLIRGDTFFTTGTTINNKLVFNGGKIRNTGTVNIREIEDAGLNQIFTLSGVQKFTQTPEHVRPEWWGGFADSIAEFNDPFEAALESFHDIDGGVIQLDSGIYFVVDDAAYISGNNVVIQGIKGKTRLVKEQGDGTLEAILRDVNTGSNYYNSITLKDIIFERGGGGNIYSVQIRGDRYAEFNSIGCTYRHRGMTLDRLEGGLIQNNYFYTEGDFNHFGILMFGGCRDVVIDNNRFRYLEDFITIAAIPDYNNTNITISNNHFDMGWFTGATRYTGIASDYSGLVLDDATASFGSISAQSTIRIFDTLSIGTGSYPENNLLEDAGATFITDGAEANDMVKVGDTYGLIEQVLGETRIQVEFWMDSLTRLPTTIPSGDYVVYSMSFGEVVSNTGTTIDVTRFWDKHGTSFVPTGGVSVYEVLFDHPNYTLICENWNTDFKITGNTVLRGWSDQISVGGKNHRIIDNRIEWGQDIGITCNDCDDAIISRNMIRHQGVGGIYSNGKRNLISDNNIKENAWENFVNVISQAGIMLSQADSNFVTGNIVSSNTDQKQYGISVRGALGQHNFINDNLLYADTAIRLHEADSTIIGLNWPTTVSDFSSTNTIYTVNPEDNGIYGISNSLTQDHAATLDGFELSIVGSTRRFEMTSTGAVYVVNGADDDIDLLLTEDYVSLSNSANGLHGNSGVRYGRKDVSTAEINGPSGIDMTVIGTGATYDINIDGGPNADINLISGDHISLDVGAADNIIFPDFTSARDDGTPAAVFGPDGSGNLQVYPFSEVEDFNIAEDDLTATADRTLNLDENSLLLDGFSDGTVSTPVGALLFGANENANLIGTIYRQNDGGFIRMAGSAADIGSSTNPFTSMGVSSSLALLTLNKGDSAGGAYMSLRDGGTDRAILGISESLSQFRIRTGGSIDGLLGSTGGIDMDWDADVDLLLTQDTLNVSGDLSVDGSILAGGIVDQGDYSFQSLGSAYTDLDGGSLVIEGSTRQVEVSSSGTLFSRNVADSDENTIMTHDYFSFSNTNDGLHSNSARISRTGTNFMEVQAPSGILINVLGTGATHNIELNGGNSGDIILDTGDDVIINPTSSTLVGGTTDNGAYDFQVNGDAIITGTLTLGSVQIISGTGDPESSVTAPIGSMYLRDDGGASTTLYIKESGVGNTGWIAK